MPNSEQISAVDLSPDEEVIVGRTLYKVRIEFDPVRRAMLVYKVASRAAVRLAIISKIPAFWPVL